ncbi:hypothetical protein F5877DRAFT_63717 [Lentinula edodes]|nr:hypothetical protein F5877DRAFT_63717 [Lentinula edodes]
MTVLILSLSLLSILRVNFDRSDPHFSLVIYKLWETTKSVNFFGSLFAQESSIDKSSLGEKVRYRGSSRRRKGEGGEEASVETDGRIIRIVVRESQGECTPEPIDLKAMPHTQRRTYQTFKCSKYIPYDFEEPVSWICAVESGLNGISSPQVGTRRVPATIYDLNVKSDRNASSHAHGAPPNREGIEECYKPFEPSRLKLNAEN